MNHNEKTKEELINELQDLRHEFDSMKKSFENDNIGHEQAKETLKLKSYLLATLMDNLPDYIYFKDIESRFIRINKNLAQSFGLSDPLQAIGKTDFDFFTEQHAQQAYNDEQAIIRTGQILSIEEKETHPDHPDTWVSTIKVPMRDKEGTIIGTFGVSRDITKRKNDEDSFHKLYLRHEAILSAVPEIIMEVDINKFYIWANKPGLEFFGKDVIGKEASYYFEGEQEIYNKVQSLFQGSEDVFYVQSWQRRYDGEKRLLEWCCKAIKDNKGNVTGALSSARDITERRIVEEKLAQEQYLMSSLMDTLPDYIYFKDTESRFIRINKNLAQSFGLNDPSQAIGKTDFDFFTNEHAQQAYRDEQTIIRTKQILTIEEKETRSDHPDSWVSTIKVPIWNNEGNIFGTFGVSRDITERKQAEEVIKLKNELLQTINAEKDKFFSIIAHDLRGPIGAFLSATQVIVEEIQVMSVEEIKEITEDMKNSAANIYSLLENLLEWSRMQRGITKILPERFLLLQETVDTTCMVIDSARKKLIKLDYNIPDNLMIFADKHMFDTVIRNLVSNAIKFTQKGGKINISAVMTKENSVEIQIKDSGIGMSEDLISKLFKLNENTSRKGTENEPSTGLGLMLCKEFVEKNGGRIWVYSEEEKGSTFCFTVPRSV
jgi:PAS domain S-box-containing protein